MTSEQLEQVEAALLCLSEARERTSRAARELQLQGGDVELVAVLEQADRSLHGVHHELMRATYFPAATSAQAQLELAPAVQTA